MNLETLTQLITVRNHLSYLINNRNLVTKDQVRTLSKIQSEIDSVFIMSVAQMDIEALMREENFITVSDNGITFTSNVGLTSVQNGAVVVSPDSSAPTCCQISWPDSLFCSCYGCCYAIL